MAELTHFENVTNIVNGYWYTFEYKGETKAGYDRFPFIYCIQPSETNLNCFMGLNLHHLPLQQRIQFMINFDKLSNFREADTRKIYTRDILINSIFPGCQDAIRYYNKKNIFNPKRIINKAVPLYLEYNGDIMLSNPSQLMYKYLLNNSKNQTTESRE